MSIGIQNFPNVDFPGTDYPDGRTKDNTGINNGTPVNLLTLGDYQQFFAKLLRAMNILPNGLPDNEYNGLQYWEALLNATRRGIVYEEDNTGFALSATLFERCIRITGGSGPYVMPDAADSRQADIVSFINDSGGNISLNKFPTGVNTINGSNTLSLADGEKVELILNKPAGNWVIKMFA